MDITIIGAGPAGYAAAFEAARHGGNVTLVETDRLGGTCLNSGCIPTKTLKASADALELTRCAREFGLTGGGSFSIDMEALQTRKQRVAETLREGLVKNCARLNIRLVRGRGKVLDASRVLVTAANGFSEEVQGDRVLLATGSDTLHLPGLPVDHTHVLTSSDVLELRRVPASMIIVGGGVIGAELAFIFRAFGSRVVVVEGQDRPLPLPSVDHDISALLKREMKKSGIGLELGRTVQTCEVRNGRVVATLGASPFVSNRPSASGPSGAPDSIRQVEAECLVVAVGRTPCSAGLGLAEAGIKTDPRGYVLVNERFETSLPGVYAIGDLLGPSKIMLAHVASAEGLAAVAACLGQESRLDYGNVPSAIFTTPEVAAVGLTEAQAKEAGIETVCSVFQFRELGKAQAMNELPGLFKIVAEKGSGRLLGAHIAGARATDLIAEAAQVLHGKGFVRDIAETVHAHPTLAEGLYEAACRFEH